MEVQIIINITDATLVDAEAFARLQALIAGAPAIKTSPSTTLESASDERRLREQYRELTGLAFRPAPSLGETSALDALRALCDESGKINSAYVSARAEKIESVHANRKRIGTVPTAEISNDALNALDEIM